MTITTKTGDDGSTRLFGNRPTSKADPRIEACGALDELNAFLGLAKATVRSRRTKDWLHRCQEDIFVVGSELAAQPRDVSRLESRLGEEALRRLEANIDVLEGRLELRGSPFYIPGENRSSALLDVCRTVARRAERRTVALRRAKAFANTWALAYLNRLSDLLYLLARAEEGARSRPAGPSDTDAD